MASNREPVEFTGEIKRETDLAYLVFDGVNEVWIPKSQIIDKQAAGSRLDDHNYEFTVPRWLATEKGII